MMQGYVYSLGYIVTLSGSSIWLNQFSNNFSIEFLSLGATLTSIIIFNLLNIRNFKKSYLAIRNSTKIWLITSISVALSWGFVYYAIAISSARFALSIDFLAIACTAALVYKNFFKMLCCIVAIALCFMFDATSSVLSLVTALLAGIGGFIYAKYSIILAKINNLEPISILAIRSYILLIFSLIAVFLSKNIFYYTPNVEYNHLTMFIDFGLIIILGILNQVVPNFCSQNGMQKLGEQRYSFFMSLFPPLTFLLQGLFLDDMVLSTFLVCLFASIVLNFKFSQNY